MSHANGLRIAVDIGGTFTDTVLMDDTSTVVATAKTATTPEYPATGAQLGAEAVLRDVGQGFAQVSGFIHGTTLATNSLIERRGASVATITTYGFRDILDIGYERRYSQYAINIEKPDLLVDRTRAYTIRGRMDSAGQELHPLDTDAIEKIATSLRTSGIEAVAVCLLHAYANPAHELILRARLLDQMPDLVVSLSHEVSPEAREFDRLCTTVANAYIQPLMARYLGDFQTTFQKLGLSCPILMMTASGGMTSIETASRLPIRLVESGPAGGAVLAARVARQTGSTNVLSFDMGGTTAKLCLIDDFRPQTARTFEIARAERFIRGSGMPVRIPVIEMIEIGAGGGSIAQVDMLGRIQVGPQSAGAVPGPAAFGTGGTCATVTDADVALGLIEPTRFAEGRLTIDVARARATLRREVGTALDMDADAAAFGVSEIVDENMASAGRMHAVESGKDLSARSMIAFGGNGPLHATRVARRAGVKQIIVPKDPGVGSAVGFLYAPVSFELVRSHYVSLDVLDVNAVNDLLQGMQDEAATVARFGTSADILERRRAAFMRYHGQGHEIEVTLPDRPLSEADKARLKEAFETEYAAQFGRVVPDMRIEILNWALSLSEATPHIEVAPDFRTCKPAKRTAEREIVCDVTGRSCIAAIIERSALAAGDTLSGPALIVEPQTTTLVSVDFSAKVDAYGNIWLTQNEGTPA
ncbi:MAG: hydantoinase/oxoprolinase family protein [Pseudomonadota bacterium]